jgi:hypothetical protein
VTQTPDAYPWVELVVVEVVVAAIPVVPARFPVVFPAASPNVPGGFVLAFPSWCLPFAVAAASERQQQDLFQSVEGLAKDSSLVVVG